MKIGFGEDDKFEITQITQDDIDVLGSALFWTCSYMKDKYPNLNESQKGFLKKVGLIMKTIEPHES